jgi:hypothetical protein
MSLRSLAYTSQYLNGVGRDEKPFTMLLASDKDGVIGDMETNGLPWRCKPDLERFKSLTMGNIVVIGAKTFLGLLQTWPGKHVLKGRDVVVIYGVTDPDFGKINEAKEALAAAPAAKGKLCGESLYFFAVPRVMMACFDVDQRDLHNLQSELAADIIGVTKPGQKVFIGGGAALNEMLYEKCHSIDLTIVEHCVQIGQRAYMGPKVFGALREGQAGQIGWDAIDVENSTKCAHLLLVR